MYTMNPMNLSKSNFDRTNYRTNFRNLNRQVFNLYRLK